MLPLLTTPGQLRRFLLVTAQSTVGTSMGYVALLLLAQDQMNSAWALAVVLTANLVPAAALAPYFGQLADRHSRRRLCVTADVLCAAAFTGIALSNSFAVTAALTFVAGTGSALFRPASRAAVPTLAGSATDEAVGAIVTAGAVASLIGPALGALILLVAPIQTLLLFNALTFAISAYFVLGLTLDGPKAPDKPWVPMTLDEALVEERFRRRAIREGIRAVRAVPQLSLVIFASAAATFAFGLANVGEPLLAAGPLEGGETAFPLIVAVFGIGSTLGALLGAAQVSRLIASILAGALIMALIAVAPSLPVALAFFALGGLIDGLSISCEQRLITTLTPEAILGRAFGLKDSLDSIALLGAFVGGALVASSSGARWVFGVSAICCGLIGASALLAFMRQREPELRPIPLPPLAPPIAATPPHATPSTTETTA